MGLMNFSFRFKHGIITKENHFCDGSTKLVDVLYSTFGRPPVEVPMSWRTALWAIERETLHDLCVR
jgi:hypothetical protein